MEPNYNSGAEDIEILSSDSSIHESTNPSSYLLPDQNNETEFVQDTECAEVNAEVITLDDCSNYGCVEDKNPSLSNRATILVGMVNGSTGSKDIEENFNEMETSHNVKKPQCSEESNDQDLERKKEKKKNECREMDSAGLSLMIDNQVQCINLHCQSGFDLAEAPVFALTYFGVPRRKNVFQKACRECFGLALRHQKKMCNLLMNNIPLMSADFPKKKDDVVVMDSIEEIYEEEILPESIISMVENELMDLVNDAVKKYNVDFQVDKAQEILSNKYENLEVSRKEIDDELISIEKKLHEIRCQIYKPFAPRIRTLQALSISDRTDQDEMLKRKCTSKTVAEGAKVCPPRPLAAAPNPLVPIKSSETFDVVAVKEVEPVMVESPKVNLPPVGKLLYPSLFVKAPVYVTKPTVFGVWLKAWVAEILSKSNDGFTTYKVRLESSPRGGTGFRTVTGRQLAYSIPSRVRYPVGTRVIALFRNLQASGKDAFYAGIVAEPPKILNGFRYLIFFDDGYAQYVPHAKILLVCESSRFVHEDVHPDSRDFIKTYLDQYPERPMVKLQQGQVVKTEWNGKWWYARVVKIDGSLAKMHFEADNRTEWIYRGSTRLGPLYSEMVAAAARKEQGALSRHRSLGIASLKKRNMPYVEYSVDQDDAKSPQIPAVSKNVAKKSTASKSNSNDASSEKLRGPPRPNEKIEFVTKGYIRTMDLTGRLQRRPFTPHQCKPSCVSWTKFSPSSCKGINLLAIPIFYGFEREIARCKSKKIVMYRGPCGRRLRNIVEMHRYLRITESPMGLNYFDFDHWVRVLDEFHLEENMYCTHVKDISYGYENTPVSCVNEINHSWPSFMDYSTCRIPQEGVNICLDEEFLVCCSCTDDCQDKEKCECWQLTVEGTKLIPDGQIDPNVGYQHKRLLEPVPTGIYECNQRCKCGPTCLNRVAQHPLQLNLQVFRTLRKGWGLRTLNDIPQGAFICIYAGRLHTEQSANDDGRMYGDEYLAELDYIEVVERFKEGYESDVMDPEMGRESNREEDEDENDDEGQDEHDELEDYQMNSDDIDYVPQGLKKISPNINNVVNTRGRIKKIACEEKSEGSEGEKEKEEEDTLDPNSINPDDDEDEDDEMKKKPSKFTAAVPVQEGPKYKSVRELFGDGADDCYIMDAKSSGNIGRYLNHSCQPNVFVQNVFVDTHDVRFPWVAFFALTYIKAGTELTWDYNYDVGSVPDKVLYCYCNSAECRGRLL